MRYGSRHADWTPFLTSEEREQYRQHMSARRWLTERIRCHEAEIAKLEIRGRSRRTASKVKEAAE